MIVIKWLNNTSQYEKITKTLFYRHHIVISNNVFNPFMMDVRSYTNQSTDLLCKSMLNNYKLIKLRAT